MAQVLADILADRFDEEPPEVKIIKQYIHDNFDLAVAVAVRDQLIIITARSSALAGAIRPHLYKIKQISGTKKRLTIRIG